MRQLVSAVVLWPLGRDFTERVLIIKPVRSSDTDHQHDGYKEGRQAGGGDGGWSEMYFWDRWAKGAGEVTGNGILDEIYRTCNGSQQVLCEKCKYEMLLIISHNYITTLFVVTKSKMLTW